jgi:hypothetical protein
MRKCEGTSLTADLFLCAEEIAMFKPILFAASGALALSSCGGSAPPNDSPQDSAATAEPATSAQASESAPETVSTPQLPSDSTASNVPLTPVPPAPPPVPAAALGPQARKGSAGAQAVLQTWARALETRRFDLAWQQFGTPPASRAAFTQWWERYRSIKVILGEGESDAAMGSLYYTAPAKLTGTTVGGKPFRLHGDVVVRRVNDVDGATPAQLRWHIGTADLKDAAAP